MLAEGCTQLEAIRTPLSLRAAVPLSPLPEADTALRAYLPEAILSRLAAGQAEWLAELRRVTVLILNLLDFNHAAPDVLEQAQAVMEVVQPLVHHYEGSFTELIVDDKGATLLAVFGLPPRSHEDDAARGVQTALAAQAGLRELGVRSAIGITTGRAFCGAVGNALRREYIVIGDVTNLAARLMQAAPDTILCDAATYQVAQGRLSFEKLPAFALKGKASPVAVYRPHGQAQTIRSSRPLIGRTAERVTLSKCLRALQEGRGGVVLIEGEPGIGKSRLMDDLLQHAQTCGVTSLTGAGDAIEKSTPYYAWRPIFRQYFHVETITDPEARRAQVLTQLQSEPELLRLAPLLNVVLPSDLPENSITEQLTGRVWADNTNDLLVRLLQKAVAKVPLLLILEDAQWLDSASWALAFLVSVHVQPVLLIIATRPPPNPLPAEYQQLLRAPGVQRLQLSALPPAEALALVCQRLGVPTVSESLAALIQVRAKGNLFFIEELTYALRDSGLIIVANGVCQTASGTDLGTLALPDTVQGVITSRFE